MIVEELDSRRIASKKQLKKLLEANPNLKRRSTFGTSYDQMNVT